MKIYFIIYLAMVIWCHKYRCFLSVKFDKT